MSKMKHFPIWAGVVFVFRLPSPSAFQSGYSVEHVRWEGLIYVLSAIGGSASARQMSLLFVYDRLHAVEGAKRGRRA
ncbi:hypothetical protein F5141DRAFT_1099591 [Pisolithus sp. B1]|nr:hypothetical protein F5141DRAFT_1099591 [Pisolithus sp. B1]